MSGKKSSACLFVVAIALLSYVAASPASAGEKAVVAYRLANWKTMHFDKAAEAKDHFTTVKRLGCEASQEDHGGHIDVAFRCPRWRVVSFDDHATAHKWQRWLQACGFETEHKH